MRYELRFCVWCAFLAISKGLILMIFREWTGMDEKVIPDFGRESLENAHLTNSRLHYWSGYYERCEDPKWTERASNLFSRGLCCRRWWLFVFRYLGLFVLIAVISTIINGGTRRCSWLRHCATSRKVAGSIPDGVIGIFHLHNPSGRTMALGSTQPLTEMNTRNISWR